MMFRSVASTLQSGGTLSKDLYPNWVVHFLISAEKRSLFPGIMLKRVSVQKSCLAPLSREMYSFELAAWKLLYGFVEYEAILKLKAKRVTESDLVASGQFSLCRERYPNIRSHQLVASESLGLINWEYSILRVRSDWSWMIPLFEWIVSFININYKSLKTKDKNLNCCIASLHSHKLTLPTQTYKFTVTIL